MTGEVHQIGGIFPVMDREIRIEPDLLGIVAQDSRADPWNVPAHASASLMGPAFAPIACAQMRSTRRVISAAPGGEGHQQDTARVAPLTIKCATRWASVFVLPDPARR